MNLKETYQQYLDLYNLKKPLRACTSAKQFLQLDKLEQNFYWLTESARLEVPIKDNQEPMVVLEEYFRNNNSKIIMAVGSTYGLQLPDAKLRVSAAKKLLLAEQYLAELTNEPLSFKITDAHRSLALQRKYFNEIKASLQAKGFTGETLYQKVTALISDPANCPPHSTGGTVDLTLYNYQTNQELDLGTKVDEINDERIYLWHHDLSDEAKQYRALLCVAMVSAGYVSCVNEWWHYSCGDKEWALRTNNPHAIYGSV
ncbi:MAG: M15 family metallopeptidase [Patescibacteria group bacterium]|jgi:D-alanyl-D-alanine dipeptidase